MRPGSGRGFRGFPSLLPNCGCCGCDVVVVVVLGAADDGVLDLCDGAGDPERGLLVPVFAAEIDGLRVPAFAPLLTPTPPVFCCSAAAAASFLLLGVARMEPADALAGLGRRLSRSQAVNFSFTSFFGFDDGFGVVDGFGVDDGFLV